MWPLCNLVHVSPLAMSVVMHFLMSPDRYLESEVLEILVVDLQYFRVQFQHTQYHNLGCKVF